MRALDLYGETDAGTVYGHCAGTVRALYGHCKTWYKNIYFTYLLGNQFNVASQ